MVDGQIRHGVSRETKARYKPRAKAKVHPLALVSRWSAARMARASPSRRNGRRLGHGFVQFAMASAPKSRWWFSLFIMAIYELGWLVGPFLGWLVGPFMSMMAMGWLVGTTMAMDTSL